MTIAAIDDEAEPAAAEIGARAEVPDPLAAALVFVARQFGRSVSNAAVLHGLPVAGGRMPLDLVGRAARNCGLTAATFRKPVADIPAEAMPALLVLEDGGVAVLLGLDHAAGTAKVWRPGGGAAETAAIADVEAGYCGLAIALKEDASLRARLFGIAAERGRHWFWSTVAEYKADYAQVALAALAINVLALASPLFIMNVYDRVIPNFAVATLWALAIGVVLALVFDAVLKVIRSQILTFAGKRADYELAAKIFAQIMAIRLDRRPASSGAFANQVREFETVREFFTSSSLVSIIDLFFIGVFLVVLFVLIGPLALVPMVAVPLVIVANLMVQRPLGRAIGNADREAAVRHSVLVEGIANLDTIRALNAEGRLQGLWERSVAASSGSILAGRFWATIAQTSTGFLQALVSIAIIAWGVYLVRDGETSTGALVAATMLAGRVLAPLGSISATLARLEQTVHSFRTIDAIMRMDVERPAGHAFVNRRIESGSIEFKAVTFRYPLAALDAE